MEYKIVEALSANILAYMVEIEMSNGWKPCGSMTIKCGGWADVDKFYQPMTREKQ